MKLKQIYESIKPDPNSRSFPKFDYKRLQKWYKEYHDGRKLEDIINLENYKEVK